MATMQRLNLFAEMRCSLLPSDVSLSQENNSLVITLLSSLFALFVPSLL